MDHLIATCSIVLTGAAPDWVHLLPLGTVRGRDGQGPYRLPAERMAEVIAASATDLPIDYDHQLEFTERNGGTAPASGWIKELQARPDGIWGRVEWTARAAEALKAKEYRFLSPVFGHLKDGTVTRLLRAGLTNKPNLELTALASRQGDDAGETMTAEQMKALRAALGLKDAATVEEITAAATTLHAAHKAQGEERVAIAAALGLKAEAKGEEIVAAAKANGTPDPTRYVAIASFNQLHGEFQAFKKTVETEKATASVDAAIKAGKLVPAQRDWAVAYAATSPAEFQAFVDKQPQVVAPTQTGNEPPAAKTKLDAEDLAVCAAMGIAPDDYAKTLGIKAAA